MPGRSSWPGIGAITAVVTRSRFGITVTVLGIASALATAVDPQGSLYNVRLLPLWFISVYLMAAWAFGTWCIDRGDGLAPGAGPSLGGRPTRGAVVRGHRPLCPGTEPGRPGRRRLPQGGRAHPPARRRDPGVGARPPSAAPSSGLLAVMVAVVPPFIFPASSLPVTVGPNEVTNWSNYNYEGYEGQTSYPEFHSLMQTMKAMGKRYGCGRAMWEYSASENRFGTPEALMLLPYRDERVHRLHGRPPVRVLGHDAVPLPQPGGAVGRAVRARSRAPVRPAQRDARGAAPAAARGEVLHGRDAPGRAGGGGRSRPAARRQDAVRGPTTTTAPHHHDVGDLPGEGLAARHTAGQRPGRPLGSEAGPASWLGSADARGTGPGLVHRPEQVERRAGPERPVGLAPDPGERHPARPSNTSATTKVTAVTQTDSSVSFHVSRVGTPVLVKVSYFPNWHASGADGPWRVDAQPHGGRPHEP